jgi:hypothetical protein
VLGRQLPGGSRLVSFARDYIVISLPANTARQHVAVIWDRGRDEQILDVITALTYRDPSVRFRVVALAMERGTLTCWCSSDKTLEQDRKAIQLACDAALNRPKRWTVAPLVPVSIDIEPDRCVLDRGNLIEGHPLLQIPQQYQLGLIGTDGARRSVRL